MPFVRTRKTYSHTKFTTVNIAFNEIISDERLPVTNKVCTIVCLFFLSKYIREASFITIAP